MLELRVGIDLPFLLSAASTEAVRYVTGAAARVHAPLLIKPGSGESTSILRHGLRRRTAQFRDVRNCDHALHPRWQAGKQRAFCGGLHIVKGTVALFYLAVMGVGGLTGDRHGKDNQYRVLE